MKTLLICLAFLASFPGFCQSAYPNDLPDPNTGFKFQINACPTCNWELYIPQDLKADKPTGTGSSLVTISFTKATDVIIKHYFSVAVHPLDGSKPVPIEMSATQPITPAYITLDKPKITLLSPASETALKVTSNDTWDLSIVNECTWISFYDGLTKIQSGERGINNITVKVAENTSTVFTRTCLITFTSAIGQVTSKLIISQHPMGYVENPTDPNNPTTSISTATKNQTLVYPNPSTGLVNIKGNNLKTIEVYNTQGLLYRSFKYQEQLELPKGLYILKLVDKNDSIETQKLIVQ